MKILLFFLTLLSTIVYSQDRGQILSNYNNIMLVDTFNSEVKNIFSSYFINCVQNNYFHEGLGVVEVIIYKDSLNRKTYSLTAILDDRYMDHPTDSYYVYSGNIFLLYNGDLNGNKIEKNISNEAINELKDMLKYKTYIRPIIEPYWKEFYDAEGKKVRIKIGKKIIYGNPWNKTNYIFNNEKDYIVIKPV